MQSKFGPESVWVYQVLRSVVLRQIVSTRATSEVSSTEVLIPQKVRGTGQRYERKTELSGSLGSERETSYKQEHGEIQLSFPAMPR